MQNNFEVLQEVDLSPRLLGSVVCLSWRGDGELFALSSVDVEGITKVRIYTKDLDLVALGRNVTDLTETSLSKLGSLVSYAPNGSLVAVPQERSGTKLFVVFLESNGLRHGEFEIKVLIIIDDDFAFQFDIVNHILDW
jgi:hypothetical protein